jgi:hypothetical protein
VTTPWGERLALGWARTYTRGLPDEAAERRCDELTSDLFEHASDVGRTRAQQTEVLGRVLWGIPADLSWRRAARAPRERRLVTGEAMTIRKVTTILFVVYAVFNVLIGLSITFQPDGVPWGAPLLVAATCMGLGLRLRDDVHRPSTVLLVAGAVIPAVTLFWMLPIFGPIAILLITLAIRTEPGRHAPTPLPAV